MHVNTVTFLESLCIKFGKSAGSCVLTLEANKPYLFASVQLDKIMPDKAVSERVYKISRCDTRLVNVHKAAFKPGQRILIYNGSGGYGDQILTWPVARYLSRQGLDVHVLTEPGNNVCWWGLNFIKTAQNVPILWETVKLFDYFAHWEAVSNQDEHQDQEHPVDAMLRKIGYDPATIPDSEKCVRPVFTPGELGTLNSFVRSGRKIGLYQLAGSNPVRTLSASDSVYLALKLAEAHPDIHWLCLHDSFVPAEYKETLEVEVKKRGIGNVQEFCAPNLRELWALTEYVSAVVCPDSMMVHIAGSLGTPCVGLWGPMSPVSRTKYYQNHHPIWHQNYCPHAPCFAYSNVLPHYCPARTKKSCDVLLGIDPAEVVEAVKKVKR